MQLKSKSSIILFTLVVVILNIASILFLGFNESKIVRIISSFLFLLFFALNNTKDKPLLIFTGLLFVSDILDAVYSNPLRVEIYCFIRLTALSILCVFFFNKIRSKKLDVLITVLFFAILVTCLLVGYKIVYEAPNMVVNNLKTKVTLLYWEISILTAALAGKYSFYYGNKRAKEMVIFTFLFVFSELFGFMYSTIKITPIPYFEILFYFAGFMYLTFYLFHFKLKKNKENKLK